jgi:hypothetical protein
MLLLGRWTSSNMATLKFSAIYNAIERTPRPVEPVQKIGSLLPKPPTKIKNREQLLIPLQPGPNCAIQQNGNLIQTPHPLQRCLWIPFPIQSIQMMIFKRFQKT